MSNSRVFWFHYNKPASNSAKKPQITVHYKGACHVVDNVVCNVKTEGRIRNSQPRWVIAGKTKDIRFENGVAIID
jgi:hypothetical protein